MIIYASSKGAEIVQKSAKAEKRSKIGVKWQQRNHFFRSTVNNSNFQTQITNSSAQ